MRFIWRIGSFLMFIGAGMNWEFEESDSYLYSLFSQGFASRYP